MAQQRQDLTSPIYAAVEGDAPLKPTAGRCELTGGCIVDTDGDCIYGCDEEA